MRTVTYEGTDHEFPDETPDEVVAQVLQKYTAPTSYSDVIKSVPGEAKRQLAESVSGAVSALSDMGVLSGEQGKEAAAARQQIQEERDLETPKNMTLGQEGVQATGTSLLTQAPAMAAGALALPFAGPAAIAGGVTTAMGLSTGLQKYGETRDAEFSPFRSSLHALFHGLVEKYTEYFPVKDLIGKPLTSAIYNFLGKEMLGEQAATLLQDLNDKLSTKPNLTLGDWMHDAAVTAIATGLSGPVQAGAMRTAAAAMGPFIRPEQITPEQKVILDAATKVATSDGMPLPMPVAPIGAVQAAPTPSQVDLGDLAMPDKVKPAEEGVQRVYGVIPTDGEVPERTVWTPDLVKLQPVIDVKPGYRVAYVDMPKAELDSSQKGDEVQKFRLENQVADGEYALPTKFASKFIYNPAPGVGAVTPIPPLVSSGGSSLTPAATPGVNNAVIYRNDQAKTKVKIEFPDEGSKLLYLFSKHLKEGASTYAGQDQIAQEKAQLVKIYSVTPDEVEVMAHFYHGKVTEVASAMRQNGTMRPQEFSKSVFKAQMDLTAEPGTQRLKKLAEQHQSKGEVLIADDVKVTPHVIKMQAFLQNWMRIFAPGTRMTIESVADRSGPAMMQTKDGVSMIRIPSEQTTKFWAVFSLAHEFGHHVFNNVMARPEYAQAVAELKLEHQALVAQVPDMTVEQFIDAWMAPHRMVYKRHVYEVTKVKPADSALLLVEAIDANRHKGYTLSFDEYAAEQFARYVGKNRGTVVVEGMREWFNAAIKEVRLFFDKVVSKLSPQKNFEKFVDALIAVPINESVYNEEKMDLLSQDSWFESVDEIHDSTTRVLTRLPKKDKVQRITIVGELARPDIKDQERVLLQSVLDTFDGDVIGRQEFEQRVLDKIIPITTLKTPKWATYGLHSIGVRATDVTAGVDAYNEKPKALAWTEVFRLPFDISKANHFADPRYFGHSRYFDQDGIRSIAELQSDLAQKTREDLTEEGLAKAIQEEEKSVKVWENALESHAGFLAHPETLMEMNKGTVVNGVYDDTAPSYLRFNSIVTGLLGYEELNQLKRDGKIKMYGWSSTPEDKSNLIRWISPEVVASFPERLRQRIETYKVNLAESQARLTNLLERKNSNVLERIESLPKRWWEFMLRKMNQEAAKDGVRVMRMATADTIAKVEGWRKELPFLQVTSMSKETLPQELTAEELLQTGLVSRGQFKTKNEAGLYLDENGDPLAPTFTFNSVTKSHGEDEDREGRTWIHYRNSEYDQDLEFSVENFLTALKPKYPNINIQTEMYTPPKNKEWGRYQGLYNRYNSEITKFVKREFGAKEMYSSTSVKDPTEYMKQNPGATGSPGLFESWLEWDVKPELGDKPIEYYDLIESMEGAARNVGNAQEGIVGEDIPDVSKSFERFTGFFLNSLQLNQLAKILPHVAPLQAYRRLMQNMSNLKNQLMAGPNERIKEWYSLSKKDSNGVQDMLRQEVEEGKHWTTLTKQTITAGGKQLDMWLHTANDRVAAEAKTRGLSTEAINLYLNIKNDFTTTLGTMEQTILNSIEEFFRNNPIAGTARQNVVRAQFEKFRTQPFLPDKRIGQWSVVIRAKDAMVHNGVTVKKGEVVYFSGHQRRFQQKREFATLSKSHGGQFAVTMEYVEDLPYVMRSLPREFIRSLPEQLQLTPDQMARYEELYYDITKEGKYLQLLGMGKKKVAGAPEDLRQAYSNYMWRTANLISKMAFSRKLQRETYNLNRATNIAAKSGGDVTALRRLHEYLVKNFDYVMRPQHEWEQLRAFVSLWYLWGVPKTALMNSTTLVTTTYPRLAAQAGDAKATGHILKAIKDVAQYWRDPSKISNEVAALFAQARSDGVTNQSFAAELAAVADGNAIERIMPQYAFLRDSGVKDSVRKATWKLVHWGMIPFRVTEEFNRRVTLLASYRIERALGKPALTESVGEGSAYLAARDTVDYTQNEYAPWNRAVFLRGKKSVALIFYSFVQNMSFFMFGGDKGWWRSLLVVAALAGLEGIPGAENVIDFLNWLARKTLDEPIDLRLEAREMATAIGVSPDYMMHGAMHSMFGLGWDTANSVGLGRIIPGTDAIFGQGDANQRIVQMAGEVGGPFVSLTTSVLQALFDDNPSTLLRFDRALPPVIKNLERGYRGATENQWTDSRGRALVDEATGLEVLGQLAGFSPTSKTTHQEALHIAKETAQFYVLRRTNLMSSLFQATESKDYDAIADAREAIREYNSKVPAPQLRITAQEIQGSLRARQRAAKEVETGVAASSRYRPLYERVGDTFAQ